MAILAFEKACEELARQVNHRLFDDARSYYWVGNEIGGSCDFQDTDFLTPEEMVLVLDYRMTYDQYCEWRDANLEYSDTKGYINLRSWLVGCRHFMLEGKPKYNEWQDADDNLPEYEEDVLVCDKRNPQEMWFTHRSANPKVLRDKNDFCEIPNSRVTHWMRIKQIEEYESK